MSIPSLATPACFPARFAALPDLLAAVRDGCRIAGLNDEATQRVELVVEEAFSNSIAHGYGCETDQPIWLTCLALTDGLGLVYQDAAPPFDPLRDVRLPRTEHPGGIGHMLIQTLPHRVAYSHENDRNTLRCEFPCTVAS